MIQRRVVVTGREGQLVRSLLQCAPFHDDFDLIAVGRPFFDLARPETLSDLLSSLQPDLVVSAAADTAVDRAETDSRSAMTINGSAPGAMAGATERLGIPMIHISTDYVFDGRKPTSYAESDAPAPLCVYGRSKLAGEIAVAAANPDHVILRTAWLYSPFGRNFVKTMFQAAQSGESARVVDDQFGNPTSALSLAGAVLTIARNLLERDDPALRGTFHLAGSGSASRADFAEEILRLSRMLGGPSALVERIATTDYASRAARPANSRLDCSRVFNLHGVRLPPWKISLETVVRRLVKS